MIRNLSSSTRGPIGTRWLRAWPAALLVAIGLTSCNVNFILVSSTPDAGTGQTVGNGLSRAPAVSADGRYTVFLSDATNLVTGDTNGVTDVFVRDNSSQVVTRFTDGSVDSGSHPTISADGSRVAYSANLPYGETGDVLSTLVVANRATVSVAFTKVASTVGSELANPSLSSNGQYVAFEDFVATGSSLTDHRTIGYGSSASSLIVFPPRTDAVQSGFAFDPKISADGGAVLFDSREPNFVAGDSNGLSDVFRWDIAPNTVTRVSISSTYAQGDGESFSGNWASSAESGAHGPIVFSSWATNLVPGDTNGQADIFVATQPVADVYHTLSRPIAGNGDSFLPSMSANGRYLAFASKATNLVPSDTNGAVDVFVADLAAPSGSTTIWRASVGYLLAQGGGDSSWPMISGNGRWVSYESAAPNLVGTDTNNNTDVFTSFAGKVTVSALSPSVLTRGVVNAPVTITGSGFTSPATVTASDPNTTFSNVVVVNDTTITATVTVSTGAPANETLHVGISGSPLTAGEGSAGECACIATVP